MKERKKIEIATRSPEQLGQALNRFRKQQGLTQSKLSEISHLRQGTISKVEKGLATTSLGAIYDICAAMNLEIVIQPRSTSIKKKKFNPKEIFD